jgi:ankyrin repeat protein
VVGGRRSALCRSTRYGAFDPAPNAGRIVAPGSDVSTDNPAVVSAALQALYEDDRQRAEQLLAPDDQLPAYEAAAFGRIARLRRLLDEDPDAANAWSPDGFSALHLAIFGGSDEAVRLLIERGADVDAHATSEIARVRPLGTAAFVGRPDLEKLLHEAGADPTLPREER